MYLEGFGSLKIANPKGEKFAHKMMNAVIERTVDNILRAYNGLRVTEYIEGNRLFVIL